MPNGTIQGPAQLRGNLGFADKKLLPITEWMAENAYVAPGLHRFCSAFGLFVGLYLGRQLMDVATARTQKTGDILKREDVITPLQPFYGALKFNPYSDEPDQRWMEVFDHLVPLVLGGIGAYMGSKYFFDFKHPASMAMRNGAEKAGGYFMPTADYMADFKQSEHFNKLAGVNFGFGAPAGFHLFLNPFSTAANAIRFQLAAGKRITTPVIGKMFFGNRTDQSMNLHFAMQDLVGWGKNNIVNFGGPEKWMEEEALLNKAQNALQCFTKADEQHITNTANYISQRLQEAARVYEANPDKKAAATELETFLKDRLAQRGFEDHFLSQPGLFDISKPEEYVKLGYNGILTEFIKFLGAGKDMDKVLDRWVKELKTRHPELNAGVSR